MEFTPLPTRRLRKRLKLGGRRAINLWQDISNSLQARTPVVVATVVRDSGSVPRRSGAKMLVLPDGKTRGTVGGGLFESLVIRDALNALACRQSVTRGYSFNPEGTNPQAFGAVCGGRAEIFLEVLMPPDRLLIVGGGHCGRALARMASLLDFSIVLADDRAEFARPEDYAYPNVESVMHLPPDYAGLPVPDENTYVALVSKGFVTDEAALRRVLDSPAAYIGMIGSKRKREVVYDALRADGVPEEKLSRVHAPIGLDIGADTPEEIAVSILAEIIQVRANSRRPV
jgi:xanthine dehydrogenase accessory factor